MWFLLLILQRIGDCFVLLFQFVTYNNEMRDLWKAEVFLLQDFFFFLIHFISMNKVKDILRVEALLFRRFFVNFIFMDKWEIFWELKLLMLRIFRLGLENQGFNERVEAVDASNILSRAWRIRALMRELKLLMLRIF